MINTIIIAAMILCMVPSVGEGRGLPKKKYNNQESMNLGLRKVKIEDLPEVKGFATKKRKRTGKITPPKLLEFSSRLKGKERKLEKALDAEIKELFKLVKKYKKSRVRGELWLRQAELYREKARLSYFRRQDDYDLNIRKWVKSGQKGVKPKLTFSDIRKLNYKAIELYNWYLADFSKSKKAPMALFFQGYNYFEVENQKKGFLVYEKLIKKYPKHSISYQAQFNLAEFYFENRKWKKALKLYATILKNKNKANYLFSLYKSSWIKYHLGDTNKALTVMEKVYRVSNNKKIIKVSKKGLADRIRAESKKNLVFFYAETGDYKEAISFFKKTEDKRGVAWYLQSLAESYVDRGENQKALFLFNQFLQKYPDDENAPKVFFSRVNLISTWEKPVLYQKQLLRGVALYSKKGKWAAKNKKNDQASVEFFRDKVKNWMLRNYRSIRFKKNRVLSNLLLVISPRFFRSFPEKNEDDNIRYLYADLLFEEKKYLASIEEYKKVLLIKNSTFKKNASLNIVLAAEKKLPKEDIIFKVVGEKRTPIKFPSNVKRFEKFGKQYIAQYPKDPESLPIKYRLGRLYYLLNHFDRAEGVYSEIIEKNPKSKYAKFSANLMLDMYNLNKDYVKLAKFGTVIIKKNKFADKEMNKNISTMIEQAEFKTAESFIEKGEIEKGISEYLRFVSNHPKSKILGIAYYNLGINFLKDKKIEKGIKYYELAASHKENKKYIKSLRQVMGPLYEKIAMFKEAALNYDLYGKKYAEENKKNDYFQNAGVLWSGLGFYKNALISFSMIGKKNVDKKKSLLLLKSLNEDYGFLKSLDKNYATLLKMNLRPAELCHTKFERAKLQIKTLGRARYLRNIPIMKKCFAKLSKTQSKKYVKDLAEIDFEIAKKDLKVITAPYSKLSATVRKKSLSKRLALLKVLDEKLKKIILLDVSEFIVAALLASGEAHQFMANYVRSMPVPRSIAGTDLANYKTQVDGIVQGLSSQGSNSIIAAKNKASSLDIVTESLRDYQGKLNRNKSNSFSKLSFVDEI